ncbi:MAG: hypothetical protein NAG76_20570 [Candidatus Pristimantibacillus lignocellulolyticus]|uniref:Uncharacterized protein n=1 Tax=Candidatus Pristimantibacillus lignocellulolyticus TaxID=2994561 RepID=A0A9J6ZDH2_9BACL|nr:MAG: hypothetical protein NAG76_20570 [Candidatus Pristimantibacillus lignocellulolyticus]
MKQMINKNKLMLSGKAKHIQIALNGIAKSQYGNCTLAQYTANRPEMRITLGNLES